MERLRKLRPRIHRILRDALVLGLSMAARERLHWFAFAADHGSSLAGTCAHFGIGRSTFLKWMRRFDPEDPSSLEDQPRRPRRVRQPEVPEEAVALIRRYREEQPTLSRDRLQVILREEHGIGLSASTIGRVIARHGFYFADTPSHRRRRGEALSEGSPQLSLFDRKPWGVLSLEQ